MLGSRLFTAIGSLLLVNLSAATCHSPPSQEKADSPAADTPAAETPIQAESIKLDELSKSERAVFQSAVSETLAPCADIAVNLLTCVNEKRACASCLPAAEFIYEQVRRGNPRAKIDPAVRMRFSPSFEKSLDLSDAAFQGPESAPVTIAEWADFQCPYCGIAAPLLHDLQLKYPGQLRLAFLNYPLNGHEYAKLAAQAVLAAGEEGKFWEMHEVLFKNQSALNRQALLDYADNLGLDAKQFVTDLDSEKTQDRVNAQQKQANALGAKGTPTIFINGRYFDFQYFKMEEDLVPWIEAELRIQGVKPDAKKEK